jgi:hypothetical protein
MDLIYSLGNYILHGAPLTANVDLKKKLEKVQKKTEQHETFLCVCVNIVGYEASITKCVQLWY